MKKFAKTAIPIAIGLLILALWFRTTSAEDRDQIWFHISHVPLHWVFFSVLLGVASHLSRAIRWNYLLEPLGHRPRVLGNFLMIMIAYFANLGIPRSGEVLRATALANYEKVPFEKGFGTVVTERIVDLLMLLMILTTAGIMQTRILYAYFRSKGSSLLLLLVVGLLGIGLLIVLIRQLKKSESPFAIKLRRFLDGLVQGIGSILKMERRWEFIGHTLFIWFCYVGMFWILKFAFPATTGIPFFSVLAGFIAGAFAMSTTNGGVGLYPVAVGSTLALLGVEENSGSAMGWIIWISQTLMVVVLGTISFVSLPFLYGRRNRQA